MQQCKYFAKGFCSRGTSCYYSHDNPPTPITLPTSLADRVGAKHSGPSHTATTPPDPRPSSMVTSTDSITLTTKDWRSETTCRYYLQGICMKGEACPFAHPSESIGRDRKAIFSNVTLPAKDRRSEIPCRYFLQGTCSKGHACSFSHKPVQSAKNAGLLEVGAEDLSNWSREIFGAIAIFGAGAQVSKVSLSSDFSAVRINGLDNDSTADSVVTILARMGFDVPVNCVRMSGNHGGPHTSADVRIEDPAFARNICSKLPGNEAVLVKHPHLQAMQLPMNILSESTAHRVDCRNVSCSWHKPSVLAWLNFSSEGIAKRVSKRFNSGSYKVCGKKVVCDQPVHSDIITHRVARGHNEVAWSIRLKDLPPTVTKKDIRRSLVEGWSEPNHIEVGEPPSNDAVNGEASALIKDKLSEFGPIEVWETSLESSEKRVKATARFQHDADAREAARCLNNKTIDRLDVGKIVVQVVNSVKFKLTTNIYDAAKPEIDSVCQTWVKNFVKCKVYRNTDPAQRCTVIRIFGEDAKEIAKAKASVEAILAGTVAMTSGSVPMWSPFFNTGAATRKFKEIHQDLNVLIVRDTKRSRLRLYGTRNNHQKALQTLESIIKSDLSKVYILELDQETFRNALNGGFQDIVSVLGKDFATIDIISTPKRIIVTGSSNDYQTAVKILNGPRSGTSDRATLEHECVVCWTEDEASIRTKCNHIYCSECFENTCSTAGSGNSEFSIRCHGDSGACQATFSLSELQEHLSSTAFEDTLKLSFMSYIRRRPHIFRFCPTPDCEQVYRADGVDKLYTCPQCITSLCTSCHISHEKLTCSEYKDLASGGQEAFERLKKERGFKDCPKCKTTMEKTEGCNHMVCSGCRIHICWVCLATFEESGQCYQHMNMKHGGIGLDNLIPDDELNMFPRLPGIRAFRRF